ncbi:MAG TPA: BtrH N-terminal domain-containing protein [Euzebyales bacterium]|nr:BtrH N-terminal domain-containing protein [Euzebyales bacterium]
MTSDKRRKARIRARMARTGERYTTARRHFVDTPAPLQHDLGYLLRGGLHPDSAALANVLAHNQTTDAEGTLLSEALLFGVMGGLGAGYILWEFAHDDACTLVLGFRNQWQHHDRAVRTALDRLGIAYDRHTTGGAAGAARRLEAQVAGGAPALIWPDRQLLGSWYLPPHLEAHGGHPVVVYGARDGCFHLDDRTLAPLTVDAGTLHRARARVGSYRNTLIAPLPAAAPVPVDVIRGAVRDGIAACIDQLGGTSASFALPAWRKWSRLMTDRRNAKGWPVVFADRVGLAGALLSVWEGVSPSGMTGGHLRDLQVDFLTAAQPLLGTDFAGAIAGFGEAAVRWAELGDIALDPGNPDFARLRERTATVRAAIAAEGDAGRAEAGAAAGELWRLRAALDAECPLDADAAHEVFTRMGAAIGAIHEVERDAVASLAAAIGR